MAGRRATAGLIVTLATAAAGCGSQNAGPVAAGGTPPARGAMAMAIPSAVGKLDPLLASTPVDQLVSRQLFEPLVERLTGPYDAVRRVPGLATSVRAASGGSIWRVRLRDRVRFQDGSPLDASAVVANATRWRTTVAGRAALPGLIAADAPRPDLVRLFFDRPTAGVRGRLASPRLGIVSPREMTVRSGTGASLARASGAGTGAFELRRIAGSGSLLARNTAWWGTPHGLGPALDQIALRVAASQSDRLQLLRRGDVEVAYELPPSDATRLRHNPLLTGVAGPRFSIGLERSVRGIDTASATVPLSGVWLTTIAAG